MGSHKQTDWSFIQQIQAANPADRKALLVKFFQHYLTKIYAAVDSCAADWPEDERMSVAHDLIVSKLLHLDKSILLKADRRQGSFTGFLQRCIHNFVSDQWREPGSPTRPIPSGLLQDQCPDRNSDIDLEDLSSATDIAAEVVKRTLEEFARNRRGDLAELLKAKLSGNEEPSAVLCNRLGVANPRQLSNLNVTVRRAFQRHLDEVIATYFPMHDDIKPDAASALRAMSEDSKLA